MLQQFNNPPCSNYKESTAQLVTMRDFNQTKSWTVSYMVATEIPTVIAFKQHIQNVLVEIYFLIAKWLSVVTGCVRWCLEKNKSPKFDFINANWYCKKFSRNNFHLFSYVVFHELRFRMIQVAKNVTIYKYPFCRREYVHICKKSQLSNEFLVHNHTHIYTHILHTGQNMEYPISTILV